MDIDMPIGIGSGGSNNFRTYGGCGNFGVAGEPVAHKRTGLRLQSYQSNITAVSFFAKIKNFLKRVARGVGRGIKNYYADPVLSPLELKFREFLRRQKNIGSMEAKRTMAREMAKCCGKLHSAALKAGRENVKEAVATAQALYVAAYLRRHSDMSLCPRALARLRWKLEEMLDNWPPIEQL